MNQEVFVKLLQRPADLRPLPLTMAYPRGAVSREAAKGALGAGGCFAIVVLLAPAAVVGWLFGTVGALFAVYLGQQVLRLLLRVRLDEAGVSEQVGAWQRAIPWHELRRFKLGFYPRGRGADAGLLVLTLKGRGLRIKHDSTLDHFPTLLVQAAAAARANDLQLHPTTAENLGQLGL